MPRRPRPSSSAPRRPQLRPRTRTAPPKLTARTADRHVLYQLAVQAPERDAGFFDRFYRKANGRPLRVLREDFCGTALLSCHFVKRHRANRAIGVDLHWPTLAWARIHNVRPLLDQDQQRRLRLVHADVLAVRRPRAQVIAALNFSYSVFHSRRQLLAYARNAFAALEPGGFLMLDAWGGPDAIAETTDRTRHHGFDYLWQQRAYDPITHRIECAIHFAFRDGTKLRDAFVYDWRLWTMAELREVLAEAGFADVHVLWEGTDQRTSTGNGVFRRREVGDNDPAWITYVVGRKPGRTGGSRRRSN